MSRKLRVDAEAEVCGVPMALIARARAVNRARAEAGLQPCGFLVDIVIELESAGEPLTAPVLAERLGTTRPGLYRTLSAAVEAGLAVKIGTGRFTKYGPFRKSLALAEPGLSKNQTQISSKERTSNGPVSSTNQTSNGEILRKELTQKRAAQSTRARSAKSFISSTLDTNYDVANEVRCVSTDVVTTSNVRTQTHIADTPLFAPLQASAVSQAPPRHETRMKTKAPSRRDLIFNALYEAETLAVYEPGVPITKAQRTAYGTVAGDLLALPDVDGAVVKAFVAAMRREGGSPLNASTARAIGKHLPAWWSREKIRREKAASQTVTTVPGRPAYGTPEHEQWLDACEAAQEKRNREDRERYFAYLAAKKAAENGAN